MKRLTWQQVDKFFRHKPNIKRWIRKAAFSLFRGFVTIDVNQNHKSINWSIFPKNILLSEFYKIHGIPGIFFYGMIPTNHEGTVEFITAKFTTLEQVKKFYEVLLQENVLYDDLVKLANDNGITVLDRKQSEGQA